MDTYEKIDRLNFKIEKATENLADKVRDKVRDGAIYLSEVGMALIEKDIPLHSKNWIIQFSIGSPAASYEIFRGTHQECCKRFTKLPSLNDPGWQDAWEGTNPFQEACNMIHGSFSDR